jgi:hypothetical protein
MDNIVRAFSNEWYGSVQQVQIGSFLFVLENIKRTYQNRRIPMKIGNK